MSDYKINLTDQTLTDLGTGEKLVEPLPNVEVTVQADGQVVIGGTLEEVIALRDAFGHAKSSTLQMIYGLCAEILQLRGEG